VSAVSPTHPSQVTTRPGAIPRATDAPRRSADQPMSHPRQHVATRQIPQSRTANALVRVAGVFVLVFATTLFGIQQLMTLPEEPLLRYAVLALPVLTAFVVVVMWHGLWRQQFASTASGRGQEPV
jgi:hypothetical protein